MSVRRSAQIITAAVPLLLVGAAAPALAVDQAPPAAVETAAAQGIPTTSYMTLAYGKVLGDPVVGQIAQARGATPAQVVLAWAMQSGYAVIPSSTRHENLASNLQARALWLTDAEMASIAALDRGDRLVSPDGLAPAWD